MKQKKKIVPVLAVILLIIVVILITLAARIIERYIPSREVQDMKEYYGLQAEDDMAMVIDDKVSDVLCKYYGGQVYVDYHTVHDKFNSRFYWDSSENLLFYTLPDNLVTVNAGSNEYLVGRENHSENYTIVRVDGETMYMALDFIEKYTNLTHEIYEDPNRVILTSVWGDAKAATAKRATQLRLKGGIKSPIVKELEKGEAITILEEGENWTKASTSDGIVGYLKTKFVSDIQTVTRAHEFEEPVFTHITRNDKIQMAWHQVTTSDGNGEIANVLQNTKGINVISPTWFYLNDNQGDIANLASKSYVDYCHQNNIEVWALVSNLENKEVNTTEVLSRTSSRQNLVNKLVSAAIEYDLDGINVDMEALENAAGEGYLQFIRELSLKCANNSIVLSVDNYVPTDYTAFYDRSEQANFADYIVVMAYDEHYVGSEEGSVSSIGFVTDGVVNTLKEVPASQVVMGCPFYTRIWALTPKDESDTAEAASEDYVPYEIKSEAVGMNTTQRRIELNRAEQVWSEEDGQYYAEYENEGVTYKVWVEDATSIEKKLNVMKSNDIAGVAFWKLGFEADSIWDTIIKYTK